MAAKKLFVAEKAVGQFALAHSSLQDRLLKLSVRNDNLNEELCSKLEELCRMKEAAIERADTLLSNEQTLLEEHLQD